MVNPINVSYPLNDRSFDYNKQELTPLQLMSKIVPIVNDVVEETNKVDNKIAQKEDSSNISKNRKLSSTGNFTGSLAGVPATHVLANVSDNADKIHYLSSQYEDGQTGLIVDGGFFENTLINKNYDGGAW